MARCLSTGRRGRGRSRAGPATPTATQRSAWPATDGRRSYLSLRAQPRPRTLKPPRPRTCGMASRPILPALLLALTALLAGCADTFDGKTITVKQEAELE